MSVVTQTLPAPGASTPGASSLSRLSRPEASRRLSPDVLRSEWAKLRTVRSTYWTLLLTAVAMVGLSALFTASYVAHYAHQSPLDRITFNPTSQSLSGIVVAQLAVAVLGVLVMTGEYSTGSIRSTLAAVPQRRLVLAAKAVAFTAASALVGIVSSFGAFFVGQAILASKGLNAHLTDPGVLRAVFGAGLYLAVVGLLALGTGTMVRRTAGGIAAVVGVLLVLPIVMTAFPSSWQNTVDPYLPSYAGEAILGVSRMAPDNVLHPWVGFGLFCAYATAALVGGAVLLRRRDA